MNKNRFKAIASIVLIVLVFAFFGYFAVNHRASAQIGPAPAFGFLSPSNAFPPTSITGAAGTVANPSSNFVITVSGGPIYCNGGQQEIAQTSFTLVASNTYLIVYNCPQSLLYAKQAVTAPGSPANQPGVPATLLYAVAGVEIPINQVVCNATACGNGGNGSLTDQRPLNLFPSGAVPLGGVTFANLPALPNGNTIFCTDCNATCTAGASTGRTCFRENGAWTH